MSVKLDPRQFPAKIVRIKDADSLILQIDCGFNIFVIQDIRLARIDAPETKGEERDEGRKSKEFLEDFLHGTDNVLVTTYKNKGKYGRYIGEVVVIKDGEMINLSDKLLEEGIVKEYK